MRASAAALCLLALAPAPAAAQPDPCAAINCAGHGTCIPEQRAGRCLCDAGYSAVGNQCVELESPSEPLRARRDPRMGQRVVDFARSQLGRTRAQVSSDGADALRLGDFLEPGEWWCGDFVSWAYASAGVPLDGGDAGGWLVTNNVAIRVWYERRDLFIARGSPRMATYEPQPGDFLQLQSPSGGGHAAIIARVEGDTLHTIEGNVSGTVEEGTYYRFRQSGWVQGIGVFNPPDEPPTVEPLEDGEGVVGVPYPLEAVITDDGPANWLQTQWTSEPYGAVYFGDPHAPSTSAHFRGPGTFHVTVTADDGRHETRESFTVRVRVNDPPEVTAQVLDQSVFAADARLVGAVEDDGVASPLTTHWSQLRGPRDATIAAPDALETRVTFHAPGHYRLRLEVTDTQHARHADVSVNVRSPLAGCRVSPGHAPPGAPAWLVASALILVGRRRRRADRAEPRRRS